jgi:DNA-directed RNA polymerase specialized sigma subunit
MTVPLTDREAALRQLQADAEEWAKAEQAHQDALEERRKNILRAVNRDRLSLKTVGDAYGVTRQYIGRITVDS